MSVMSNYKGKLRESQRNRSDKITGKNTQTVDI